MLFQISLFSTLLPWVCFAATLETITRDVAVTGGGSSGTYAAIKLRDANFSVAVIERNNRLGGHAVTYTDPESGLPVDYGVIGLGNTPIVEDYLTRPGLTPEPVKITGGNISFFDFETGELNPYYVRRDPTAAIQRYAEQLAKYPYLSLTYDLPENIPEDLPIPLGDFMAKYDLGDASREIYQWAQGFGNILEIPTLYIIKFLSPRWLSAFTDTGFLVPSNYNMSSIYERASRVLGEDVIYGSMVKAVDRGEVDKEGYIKITVSRGAGELVVRAKRLIVSIPTLLTDDFLGPLSLDTAETGLFRQFKSFGYWSEAVREPAIPAVLNVQNVSPGDMTTPYSYAELPAVYFFRVSEAPEIYIATYDTPEGVVKTDEEVKDEIMATMQRLRGSSDYNTTVTEPAEIVAFNNHSPYALHVDADAIKAGFYRALYELQGHQNTRWTGAAWVAHDSAALWEYTASVIAPVTQGL